MAKGKQTKSVGRLPNGPEDYSHTSTSVRKIDNGYLVTKTKSTGLGHQSQETFMRDKPTYHPMEEHADRGDLKVGNSSLSKAVSHLKRC